MVTLDQFLGELNLTTSEASSARDFPGSGPSASSGTEASITFFVLTQLQGHVLSLHGKNGWRSHLGRQFNQLLGQIFWLMAWCVLQQTLSTSIWLHSPLQEGVGVNQKSGSRSQGQGLLLAPKTYPGLQPDMCSLNCTGKGLGEGGGETGLD